MPGARKSKLRNGAEPDRLAGVSKLDSVDQQITNSVVSPSPSRFSFSKDHKTTTKPNTLSTRLERKQQHSSIIIKHMSSTTSKAPAMWRSKLGTDYPKEFMEQNETRLLKELQAVKDKSPDNKLCADCGTRGTVWASINLGVFLCMTCGAHHRSLGTHISVGFHKYILLRCR